MSEGRDSGEEALPPLLLGFGQPFGYTRFFPTLPYLLYQDHPDMNPVPCSAEHLTLQISERTADLVNGLLANIRQNRLTRTITYLTD